MLLIVFLFLFSGSILNDIQKVLWVISSNPLPTGPLRHDASQILSCQRPLDHSAVCRASRVRRLGSLEARMHLALLKKPSDARDEPLYHNGLTTFKACSPAHVLSLWLILSFFKKIFYSSCIG